MNVQQYLIAALRTIAGSKLSIISSLATSFANEMVIHILSFLRQHIMSMKFISVIVLTKECMDWICIVRLYPKTTTIGEFCIMTSFYLFFVFCYPQVIKSWWNWYLACSTFATIKWSLDEMQALFNNYAKNNICINWVLG